VLDELTARMRTDKMMPPLAGLLGVLAALILAAAFANACAAMLMRRAARTHETALKIALGASPLRLLHESVRESGTVAAMGCGLALPFASVVTEALQRSIVLPTDFSISIAARIDVRVVTLAFLSSIVAATVSAVRMDVWEGIKTRSASVWAHKVIATLQIALAAALTSTGGSLWIGLSAAKDADLGYRTNRISVMTFDPGQSGYNEARTRGFYNDLLERVKIIPGVRRVALAQNVPLGMTGAQKQIRIRDDEPTTVWMNVVTPEYFDTMRIGMVAGRGFHDGDGAVVIVNEELAKRVALGEKMEVGGRTVEVIGVVRTAKYMRWDEAPRPFLYLPYSQNYASRMTLHIEADEDVFRAVRRLAREIPMSDARNLREYFDNGAMFGVKVALRIAGIVGSGGLLLALAGLHSVVSSAVARRRREIGIRVALGARRHKVVAMVMREGMTIAVIGTAAGLAVAQLGSNLLRGLVPGPASSIWASAAAAGLVLGASMIASAVPAIRALKVDPAALLRQD
jgi:predicted permease